MRLHACLAAALALTACGGPGSGDDAGRVVDNDAGATCGEPATAADGARCRCASDCLEGAACFPEGTSGFAGGFCRRACDGTACSEGYTCAGRGSASYCALNCSGPADCGSARVCNDGLCMPFCLRDTDCDSGRCNVWSGTCLGPGEEVAGARIGAPCLRDADCRSDLCSSAGICLSTCSIAGQTCPEGAICVGTSTSPAEDWGLCLLPCEADGTCAQRGAECIDLVVPEGVRACLVGAGCLASEGSVADAVSCGCDLDCASGSCLAEHVYGFPGGLCHRECTDDSACGGLLCRRGTCLTPCMDNTACRDGYACDGEACQPLCQSNQQCLGGSCDLYTGLCAPGGTGGGIGAACAASEDCRSGYCNTSGWPEGYCISECSVSAQVCPEAAYCRPSSTGDVGLCTRACTTQADCAQASAQCTTETPGAPLHCW